MSFTYLKTTHSYHLVDPSPWPIVAAFGAFMLTTGTVLYMHKYIGGWNLLSTGFLIILYVMYTWWRDVIREATFEDTHSIVGQKSLIYKANFFLGKLGLQIRMLTFEILTGVTFYGLFTSSIYFHKINTSMAILLAGFFLLLFSILNYKK